MPYALPCLPEKGFDAPPGTNGKCIGLLCLEDIQYFPKRYNSRKITMSQIENHWDEVVQIELELMRHMVALGIDWHDDSAMTQLAMECKSFGPANAKAAYASNDQRLITKAELFGLASIMLRTMESAANDERDVHGGEIWKAFGRHLYS